MLSCFNMGKYTVYVYQREWETTKLVKCRKMGENVLKLPSSKTCSEQMWLWRWSVMNLRWWEPKTRELQWNMKTFSIIIGRIKLTKLDGLGNWRHKIWYYTVRLCCLTEFTVLILNVALQTNVIISVLLW